MKGDAALRIGLEHPIDDDAVEVQMGVEQRTETVEEDHRTEALGCAGARSALSQHPLDGGKQNVQCGVQNCRITFQVIARPVGRREYPLPYRQTRDDVIGQMPRPLQEE